MYTEKRLRGGKQTDAEGDKKSELGERAGGKKEKGRRAAMMRPI